MNIDVRDGDHRTLILVASVGLAEMRNLCVPPYLISSRAFPSRSLVADGIAGRSISLPPGVTVINHDGPVGSYQTRRGRERGRLQPSPGAAWLATPPGH